MIWTLVIGTILTTLALLAPELLSEASPLAPSRWAIALVGIGGTGFVAALQLRISRAQACLRAQEVENR